MAALHPRSGQVRKLGDRREYQNVCAPSVSQKRVAPCSSLRAQSYYFSISARPLKLSLSFAPMTWIKTVPLSEASAELIHSLESQRPLYPQEYEAPVMPMTMRWRFVASHSLIPGALLHAFSTF